MHHKTVYLQLVSWMGIYETLDSDRTYVCPVRSAEAAFFSFVDIKESIFKSYHTLHRQCDVNLLIAKESIFQNRTVDDYNNSVCGDSGTTRFIHTFMYSVCGVSGTTRFVHTFKYFVCRDSGTTILFHTFKYTCI